MKGAREFSAALTPFARAILAVAALVILGISLTIARGDRVGVRLVRAEPEGETHSDGSILLQFSAEMERASVEGTPALATVRGRRMALEWQRAPLSPCAALAAG